MRQRTDNGFIDKTNGDPLHKGGSLLNFLEHPCHEQAMDAIRGLLSIGEKGNSCAYSARLT